MPAEVDSPSLTLSMGPWSDKLLKTAPNASAYFEVICRRYEQFMLAGTPGNWSLGQWAVAVLALKDDGAGLTEFDSYQNVMGWANYYRGHAQEMYGVDPAEVARDLADRGPGACIAVCEVVDRYWRYRGKATHAERMEAMGLATRKDVLAWNRGQKRRKGVLAKAQARAAKQEAEWKSAEQEATTGEAARDSRAD